VQAALAHYQFETLHPYYDGNGRIGRLAVALQLMLLGDLQEPLLTVSPWLERRREEYQDRLLEVSRTGDFDQWVRFFCSAIRAQAEQTVQKIDDLLSLRSEMAARIREVPIRGVGQRIAEDLIGQPVTTPTYASDLYNVNYPAANQAIARLVDLGLLEELTGRNYGRMFGCRRVIDILDA
jgi:Fic family protein